MTRRLPRSVPVSEKQDVEVKGDVFTIGHSNRSFDELRLLLQTYGITCLVDIRTIPKSRHNPQYNQDVFKKNLRGKGIEYCYLKGLGGLRHPSRDSINTGWRNSSFRGYADYMQTEEFGNSVSELIEIVSKKSEKGRKVAYMCAEALPWRCHRSLVADALTVRGLKVVHIISLSSAKLHKITSFAKVMGNEITYPSTP